MNAEGGLGMWYLQHRLFAQVVHLLSDGAFTCMDEGSERKSNSLSRACRRDNVTRCPISYLLLCATRNRPDAVRVTKEKRGKCTSVHAAGVLVYPMTPSGWQGEHASGTCTSRTLEFNSHLWGSGRAFHASATRILFEILFENSINGADFAERIGTGSRHHVDSGKNNGKKRQRRQVLSP